MSEFIVYPKPSGASYIIPDVGDNDWGQNVTNFLVAIPNGTVPTAGTFTLTGDLNWGATFGLISKYFTTESNGAATAGVVRLAHNDIVAWRNAAGTGNLNLTTNGSDQLTFNGAIIPTGSATFVSSITGTANQIIASASTGAVTLSLPQSINTTATVTFGSVQANVVAPGSLFASGSSGVGGQLTLNDKNNIGNVTIFGPASSITSYSLILPTTDGSNGQVLTQTNNSTGQLGWTTPTTGTVTSVSGTANQITSTGGATPVLALASPLTAPGAITATGNVSAGTNQLIGTSATLGSTGNNGSAFLTANSGNNVQLTVPAALAGSYSLTLPTTVGSTGSVLTANVSGSANTLSWTAPATGTVTSVSGTANQITSTGGATPVLALASPLTTPGAVTVTGNLSFASTSTQGIKGTTTNDSAAAGNVGEYIIATSAQISIPGASNAWGDIVSISLTAGDWDVTMQGFANPNGAVVTNEVDVGIGTVSGNTAPTTLGVDWTPNIFMIASVSTGLFFTKRMSLSSTTTVYAKIKTTYTGSTPVVLSSLFARRMR